MNIFLNITTLTVCLSPRQMVNLFGQLARQTDSQYTFMLSMFQEWWGLNDQIAKCGQEVSQGTKMRVLVPDLYRGKVTTDHEEAGHFMGDLDWQGEVQDIQGCARWVFACVILTPQFYVGSSNSRNVNGC